MRIQLDLTDVQAGYLVSATSEFFHNMKRVAESEGYVVPGMDTRLVNAKEVWDQVQEAVQL